MGEGVGYPSGRDFVDGRAAWFVAYVFDIKGNPSVFFVGGKLSIQSAARKYSILRGYYQADMSGCRMISLCFVGEARFAKVGKVGFYGGVGAGVAQCLSSKFEFNAERPFGPVVKPYVGIECWNYLRVGVEGGCLPRSILILLTYGLGGLFRIDE